MQCRETSEPLKPLLQFWPLCLEPEHKLYLLALSETLDPRGAAELACLSEEEAVAAREYLINGELIRSDGNVDVECELAPGPTVWIEQSARDAREHRVRSY